MLAEAGDPFAPDWFRLTEYSPVIYKALVIPEIRDDYFGTARGSSPEMGAIEYFLKIFVSSCIKSSQPISHPPPAELVPGVIV